MSGPMVGSASELSTRDRPLLSVLVLTWNHENFIEDCLRSILDQSDNTTEIICCENGSSDRTWQELERIAASVPHRTLIRYQNPPGTPVNVGFNGMIERANGDFLCFFSGDDLFVPGRIASQLATFASEPDLQVVYSNGVFLGGDRDGEPVHDDQRCLDVFRREPEQVLRYIFENRGLMIQTMMVRRDLIDRIGGFDEDALADDWILNIRIFNELKAANQYKYMSISSFMYRQHESNSYKNYPRQSKLMIGVIDRYYHFPDRRAELARMYDFQVDVGLSYGFKHIGLTLKYLLQAAMQDFRPRRLVVFPLRILVPRLKRYLNQLRGTSAARDR